MCTHTHIHKTHRPIQDAFTHLQTQAVTHTYSHQHTQTDIFTGNGTTTALLASPLAMENLEIKTNLLFIPSRSSRQTSIQSFEGGETCIQH